MNASPPYPFASELPKVGDTESTTLDFKRDISTLKDSSKLDYFELAKDVSAMANASGGTIVIGAAENGGRLAKYFPLTSDRAREVRRAYEEAVRDRCQPQPPGLRFRDFPEGHGLVLAVDITASVAVIAAEVSGDAKDGYGESAWVFFERSNSQTRALSPERLPMLMVPEIRRIVLGLRTVLADPSRGSERVYLKFSDETSYRMTPNGLPSTLLSVDEEANTVKFSIPGDNNPAYFGLEEFLTVHQQTGGWCVKLKRARA